MRDRPSRTRTLALLSLAATSPLVAGCVGVAQATAQEHEDESGDLAAAWDPAAELASVYGFEGSGYATMGWMFAVGSWGAPFGGAGGQGSYWSQAERDEHIGDGQCEIWMYRFISSNRPTEVFVVVLDRDGNLVHEGVEARKDDDRALGRWVVDSDEAADIANDANQGLARGTSSEHYGIVLVLSRDDEHANAVWLIAGGGGDPSGGGGGVVVLDAVTGEVYKSEGGFGQR